MEQATNELTSRNIKLFMLFDETIKFTKTQDDKIAFCSDGLFYVLFGDNKYGHQSKIRKMSTDGILKEGNKNYEFFTLHKYERYFMEYKVQSAAFIKSIEQEDGRYDNYVEFIKNGGVNWIYEKAMKELGEDPTEDFKNIDPSYLVKMEQRAKKEEQPIELDLKVDNKEPEAKEEITNIEVQQAPIKRNQPKQQSSIRRRLTDRDVYLNSSVLLVFCLMPFTFMALMKYMSLHTEGWQLYLSYIMVGGLSFAFDWSILVFTINGKKRLANIGSFFQIVFISVHFDLISDIIGDSAQMFITKTFAVVYAAILINQFSELSNNENEDD